MSNLDANFGQLLSACIIEYRPVLKPGDKPWIESSLQTLMLDDYEHRRWVDRGLAARWAKALAKYDVIVTWNGVRFDMPFLSTRLKSWNLKEFVAKRHKDLMYTARYGLRLNNATLDNVATFLDIHKKYGIRKTRMEPKKWVMAMGGHRPSYDYIWRHCQIDVKVLAAVWEELRPFIREIK